MMKTFVVTAFGRDGEYQFYMKDQLSSDYTQILDDKKSCPFQSVDFRLRCFADADSVQESCSGRFGGTSGEQKDHESHPARMSSHPTQTD